MQCVSTKQLAVMFPIYDAHYWRRLLREGKVPGAHKPFGGRWFVPIESARQLAGATKSYGRLVTALHQAEVTMQEVLDGTST